MKARHHFIHFRIGQQFFRMRRHMSGGQVWFVGSLNGIDCGFWPTKEAAIRNLLRRAASVLCPTAARHSRGRRRRRPLDERSARIALVIAG